MKLYLAHPFDSRSQIRKWELEVEKRTGAELFNPFYDAPGRTDIEVIDAGRQVRYEKIDFNELVKRDLSYLQQCDGVVAIIDGAISYGTIMEIVYANLFRLPVYLIITNNHQNHPWLRFHAKAIFLSIEDFEEYLKRLCARGGE